MILKLLMSFTLLSLISCAEKPEQTNMKVSIGALTGSSNFPAGLFILGEHIDTGNTFSKLVPADDSLEIEIPNGEWNFTALGWDGASSFEGDVYCDVQRNLSLSGGDFDLTLRTTEAKCSDSVFGPYGAENFLPISFNTCMDIKGHLANGSQVDPAMTCDGASHGVLSGGAKSVRVSMTDFDLGTNISNAQKILTSKCYDFTGSNSLSSIKLPFGSSNYDTPYIIETFSSVGCGDAISGYSQFRFPNAFSTTANSFTAIGVQDLTGGRTSVFLHADACNASQIANSPFANGSPSVDVPRLICSAAQWNQINSDINTNTHNEYVLGVDIDFGGSNTTIVDSFNGTFRGNYHTLKNGNQPLFAEITNNTTTKNSFRNLAVDSFIINESPAAVSTNYGVIARKISSSGGSENFEFGDIKVTNSSIILSDTSWIGNAGGIAGVIDFTGAGAQVYGSFRKVNSFVNITTDTVASGGYIGGFAGKVSGSTPNNNSGIYFEYNTVGVEEDIKPLDLDINRISITSGSGPKIGGLFGQASNVEIRDGNLVSSEITAGNYVGGLVGDAQTNLTISDSLSSMTYTPVANSSRIGGVIGAIAGDFIVNIDGVVANLAMPLSGFTLDQVGGFIGSATAYTMSENLEIKNSRSIFNIQAGGNYFGGFIGKFSSTTAPSGVSIISSSALGKIKESVLGSGASSYRGGIVGYSKNLSAKNIISNAQIEGDSRLGGAAGYIEGGSFYEVDVTSLITSTGGLNLYTGGFAGSIEGVNADLESIKISGTINTYESGGCDTLYCGAIVGKDSTAGSGMQKILANVSLYTDANSGSPVLQGDTCNGSCGGVTDLFSSIDSSTCASLTGLTNSFTFNSNINACSLVFEKKWRDFGYELEPASGAFFYRAGSQIEPFLVGTPQKWNEIEDNKFLMTKSFKLTNDLDFNGITMKSIGTSDSSNSEQIFDGIIIPDGHKLININQAYTGVTSSGLFPHILKHAKIGLSDDPLIIENSNLTFNVPKSGIVGVAEDGEISVQARNVHIDSSASANIGGILGYVASFVRMNNSSFEGSIEASSSSGVGGLIGGMISSTSEAYIENSFVNVQKIEGATKVGALIGNANATMSININNSYAWIDINNLNMGDDFAVTGTQVSGIFIGDAEGSNLSLNQIYADVSNAQINANAACYAYGSTASTSGSVGNPVALVGGGGGRCIFSSIDSSITGTLATYPNHALLATGSDYCSDLQYSTSTSCVSAAQTWGGGSGNSFDVGDNSDWVFDANGYLRAEWELFGFNN